MASRFVGRHAEHQRLDQLVAQELRCVTVLGPGGIGKTRLVREWMRASPVAALFCDCSNAHSTEALVATVAHALGLRYDEGTLSADIARALHEQCSVLILDNLEQLLREDPLDAVELIAGWLERTERLQVLVTSRIPLGPPVEETLLELGPLPRAEALALFTDRAERASEQTLASLTREDHARIGTILAKLDGLPLAIELVAAQMDLLDTTALLSQLSHHLDFSHPKPAHPRHASLRAALETSWSGLGAAEQAVWSGCAVFRSPFAVEAAAAATGQPVPSLLMCLRTLRNRSLLRHHAGSPPRLSYYETIRTYAFEKLSPQEHRRAQQRCLNYYGSLGEELATAGSDVSMMKERLLDEGEELIACIEHGLVSKTASDGLFWALFALNHVLTTRGPLAPLRNLLDEVLSRAGQDVSAEAHAAVLLSRGQLNCIQGRLEESRVDLEAGLALLQASGEQASPLVKGRLHVSLGRVLGLLQNTMVQAQLELQNALACFGACIGRPPAEEIVRVHSISGALYHEGGHYAEAEIQMQAGLELSQASKADRQTAVILGNLGVNHQAREAWDKAHSFLEQALVLHTALNHPRFAAVTRFDLARLDFECGELERAQEGFEAVCELLSEVGAERMSALARLGLAGVLAELGRNGRSELAKARLSPGIDEGLVHLYSMHHDVYAARSTGEAPEALGAEIERRASVLPLSERDEVRMAVRLLQRGLERAESASRAVRVGRETRTIALPEPGGSISLSRRATLWRMMEVLVLQRLQSPGQPVSQSQLVEQTWPGELILEEAAKNRVRVALSTLRKMGLKEVIVTVDGGYLIPAEIVVRWV